jgi:hypothetical protein
MANTEGEMLLPPTSRDSMQITGANATSLDLNIDVVIAEWLGRELIPVEFRPFLRILNLEANEGIWIHHFAYAKFHSWTSSIEHPVEK